MEEVKPCCKCKQVKVLSDFQNWKAGKDGKSRTCRECCNNHYRQKTAHKFGMVDMPKCQICNTEIQRNNKYKLCAKHIYHNDIVKKRINDHSKINSPMRWRNRTPEQIEKDRQANKIAALKYRENNKERLLEMSKNWAKNNPDKVKEIQKKRRAKRKQDIKYLISERISQSIRRITKNKVSKNFVSWQKLLGFTKEDFRTYFESKFQPGMTWDHFLKGEIHIDHIIPNSHFKYTSTNDYEFKLCWNINNLQPLWKVDNLSKKDKLPPNYQELLEYIKNDIEKKTSICYNEDMELKHG